MTNPHYAVIMAGGSGTRFWPASRRDRPKQLLSLGGCEGSLLAATIARVLPQIPEERVFVVTAERLAADTRAALSATPAVRMLCEPAARNTAPCVAWATSVIADEAPNATVMVLPSDHAIIDTARFRETLTHAMASAEQGHITTIGIVPTRAETGYGYIELGAPAIAERPNPVVRFVEKPDRARAEQFLAGGKHLWNAGMFFYRVGDMQRAVAEHLPQLAAGIERLAAARARGDAHVLSELFPQLPSISLDHGVLEKQGDLRVVPGDFGWSDVGSWQSAWELAEKDAQGNVLSKGTIAVDSHDNLVAQYNSRTDKKLISLVGVRDLCVVETDDAILVIPKERAQDVRKVVERLEHSDLSRLL